MSRFKLFLVLSIAFVLTSGFFTACAQGPSFNCAKAKTATAVQICGDPDLSAKDRTMAAAYHEVLQRLSPDQTVAFRRAHLAWFKSYQARCGGSMEESERTACIAEALDTRTAQLQQLVPAPQTPSTAYSMVSACFSAAGVESAATAVFAILIDIFTGVDIDWEDLVGTALEAGIKPCVAAAIKKLF